MILIMRTPKKGTRFCGNHQSPLFGVKSSMRVVKKVFFCFGITLGKVFIRIHAGNVSLLRCHWISMRSKSDVKAVL